MKNITILCFILCGFISCKSDKKDNPSTDDSTKSLTVAEEIAKANGLANWKDVTQIDFTFNVDRDTIHFERSWSWKSQTDDVTLVSGKDTISFNRKSVDSTSLNADKDFINDKYWLLAPYQLVWDQGASVSEPIKGVAPISQKELNKITLTYPSNGGGYTPGDAYDFFYDDEYIVREWIFRQGNADEPSMMTTWEDYENFHGLNISKTHKKPEGNWKLYFTNIKVTK